MQQPVEHLPAAASNKVELVGPASSPPAGRCDSASGVFATVGLQLERVRAAQARGTRVEVWFADEARIGQKNSLTRVWGQTDSRPLAPKESWLRLGLCVWGGLPVGGQGGGVDHADLQHPRHEPPSPRDRQSSRGRCSCRGDPRWCWLAQEPRPGGPRQYNLVGAAALQSGAQPGRTGLALSAQPLARQLGIS
jgi:hypothetical protein